MSSSFTERHTEKERVNSANFHSCCLSTLAWIPLPKHQSFTVISKGEENRQGLTHTPPWDKLVKEPQTENRRRGRRHTSQRPGRGTDGRSELDPYCPPLAQRASFFPGLNRGASLLLRTRKESGKTRLGAVKVAWDLEPDTLGSIPIPPLTTYMSLGK